jgi:uncharacterized membrane protein YdjX (TVP38/TMEM64 family)
MIPKAPKVASLQWSSWSTQLALLSKRWEFWLLLAGAPLAFFGLWWLRVPFATMLAHIGDLRDWILTFGPLAPLAYIGIFSLQIVVAPIPGQFLGVMGGYLFGALLGSFYSIIGLVLGAGVAIILGRRFGRPLLERFFGPVQLVFWEKKLRTRSGFTWWLLFLFPVPDVIFYVAGLSSTSLRTLLIALIAGRGLGLLFATTMGHWSATLSPQWVLAQWATIALIGVFIFLYQRRVRLLTLVTARRLRRWSRRYAISF